MADLRSIGITREQEELFNKVKKAVGNYSGLENDLKNHPERIYSACKRSGRFTEEELEFLEDAFGGSMLNRIIRLIKRIFKL